MLVASAGGRDQGEETISIAAGWYADPVTPGGLRWWDGTAWTASVAVPPPTAAAAPPPYVPVERRIPAADPAGWTAMDLVVPRARSLGVRALVWGIVAMILPVAILPAVLAIVFGAGGLDRGNALRRAGMPAQGRTAAIVGLVLGGASVVVLVIVLLVVSRLG